MLAAMAIVDFIPVAMFLISSIILQRGFYNKMSKGAFALFSAGTIMVFTAGLYKAAWKLLLALNICDFEKLNLSFMPMQATGFFLIAAAFIAMLFFRQGEHLMAFGLAPAVFSGTGIFVTMMCAGIGVLSAVLSYCSVKLNRKGLIALFVLAFVGMLCMGYLSSRDFDSVLLNWTAEAVNIIGQGSLLLGSVKLRKAGLQELTL
ncbi:MAG: hypothetical protein HUJ66_02180 [Oscillospiraceae bacterium]|nr:hypothetical protein [Oscillospiraceae bacterium]